jgi:Protein of unknown function (DUF2628)
MPFYTVHLPADAVTADDVAEKAVFVKEGFAIFGFAFSGLWLLFNRVWLPAIGYGISFALMLAAFYFLSLPMQVYGIVSALMAALVGLEGNEWKRRQYARNGWSQAGTVSGPNLAECERRFFKNWLAQTDNETLPNLADTVAPSTMPRPAPSQILGVFPAAKLSSVRDKA